MDERAAERRLQLVRDKCLAPFCRFAIRLASGARIHLNEPGRLGCFRVPLSFELKHTLHPFSGWLSGSLPRKGSRTVGRYLNACCELSGPAVHQIDHGQARPAQLPIQPEAEVVQPDPGRQAGRKALQRMGPFAR